MPFGLNIAPWMFTKLTRVVLKKLRGKGIMVVAYLDDWLVWAGSAGECQHATEVVIEFLVHLGFKVNLQKSRLLPQRVFQWLGLVWDLRRYTLSIPEEKKVLAASRVRAFLRQRRLSRRNQESLGGLLQFLAIVDPVLKCRLKDFLRHWVGRASPARRDQLLPSPRVFRKILNPWKRRKAFNNVVPLQLPPPSFSIHTDASNHGWGAHTERRSVQGCWSATFKTFHINVLELMAVLLALKRLRPPRGAHFRLVSDNMTTVLCLRRGGSRSRVLNQVVLAIIKLLDKNDWSLTPVHLAGVRNVLADSLSRETPIESKWTLSKETFAQALQHLPPMQVDLFATHENHQLPLFVTPYHHQGAVGTDALELDWNRWTTIYLFPPVSLLLKVLLKLKSYKGKALLVAPLWPNSPWFPLLLQSKPQKFSVHSPSLCQQVRGRICYDSSFLTSNLHMWIFSQ